MGAMRLYDLNIGSLGLTINNAQGYEHRIRPIAGRAAALFAERLEGFSAEASGLPEFRSVIRVSALPVSVDLTTMTDEDAAASIARAWLEAVTLKLR
jgi:hypothetical protein